MADLLNPSALEPLFAPWEEPNSHRVRADKEGDPAKIVKGRRPSPIRIAQNIRGAVREWRDGFYAGASDTTRYLLDHWSTGATGARRPRARILNSGTTSAREKPLKR
jgi:type III restriction enzyme